MVLRLVERGIRRRDYEPHRAKIAQGHVPCDRADAVQCAEVPQLSPLPRGDFFLGAQWSIEDKIEKGGTAEENEDIADRGVSESLRERIRGNGPYHYT